MSYKKFFLVTGIIFLVIAILHFLRLILGWKAEIGGLVLPMQVSWLALGLSISLAVSAWHLWKQ